MDETAWTKRHGQNVMDETAAGRNSMDETAAGRNGCVPEVGSENPSSLVFPLTFVFGICQKF